MKEKRERIISDSGFKCMEKHISSIMTVLVVAAVLISTCFCLDAFSQNMQQQIRDRCANDHRSEECHGTKGEQIMKLNKINARKLSDQIMMLGQDPKFSDSFFEAVWFGLGYKSLQDALDKKRKAYNLALVNLFDEYGIHHPNVYGDLDQIWEKTFVEYPILMMGPLGDLWHKRISSFRETWKGYLKETQKFALNLVKEQSRAENLTKKEGQ